MDRWEACGGDPIDEKALEGRECYGGLDLATISDVAALVLVFPDGDDGYDVLCRFGVPEETLGSRSRSEGIHYDVWARDGWIIPTTGNAIDHNKIREDILELSKRFTIREIGFDPHEATQLSIQLAEEHGVPVVKMPQGTATLNAPSKELERLVTTAKLRHGGNPVLRWMAGNVAIYEDGGGRIRPDKKRSKEKIDGIVALIMALGRATMRTEEEMSIYATMPVYIIG